MITVIHGNVIGAGEDEYDAINNYIWGIPLMTGDVLLRLYSDGVFIRTALIRVDGRVWDEIEQQGEDNE